MLEIASMGAAAFVPLDASNGAQARLGVGVSPPAEDSALHVAGKARVDGGPLVVAGAEKAGALALRGTSIAASGALSIESNETLTLRTNATLRLEGLLELVSRGCDTDGDDGCADVVSSIIGGEHTTLRDAEVTGLFRATGALVVPASASGSDGLEYAVEVGAPARFNDTVVLRDARASGVLRSAVAYVGGEGEAIEANDRIRASYSADELSLVVDGAAAVAGDTLLSNVDVTTRARVGNSALRSALALVSEGQALVHGVLRAAGDLVSSGTATFKGTVISEDSISANKLTVSRMTKANGGLQVKGGVDLQGGGTIQATTMRVDEFAGTLVAGAVAPSFGNVDVRNAEVSARELSLWSEGGEQSLRARTVALSDEGLMAQLAGTSVTGAAQSSSAALVGGAHEDGGADACSGGEPYTCGGVQVPVGVYRAVMRGCGSHLHSAAPTVGCGGLNVSEEHHAAVMAAAGQCSRPCAAGNAYAGGGDAEAGSGGMGGGAALLGGAGDGLGGTEGGWAAVLGGDGGLGAGGDVVLVSGGGIKSGAVAVRSAHSRPAAGAGSSGDVLVSTGNAGADSGSLHVRTGAVDSGTSGGIDMAAGASTLGDGGAILLSAGNAEGVGRGGGVVLASGASEFSTGGAVSVLSRAGGVGSASGDVVVASGGSAGAATAGTVRVLGGASVAGGSVQILAGNGSSTPGSVDVAVPARYPQW